MARIDFGGLPRNQPIQGRKYAMYRFNESVASFPVPDWFVNNRDTLYVTCTGGGGSAGAPNGSLFGVGGGAAGSLVRAPIRLWGAVRTLKVVVGAGAPAAAQGAAGGNGGGSFLYNASNDAILAGVSGGSGGITGSNGVENSGAGGPVNYLGCQYPNAQIPNSTSTTTSTTISTFTNLFLVAVRAGKRVAYTGRNAFDNNVAVGSTVYNVSGFASYFSNSMFGGGANTSGGYGYGYGAARNASAAAGPGAFAGGGGFMILEFEEGA